MFKPAFSTVACPHMTLAAILDRLETWGYLGVELRTFGNGSSTFAPDPALTSTLKLRSALRSAGVEACSLATSIAFDEPVSPPIIGNAISDNEKSIRAGKSAVDLAIKLECPFVRVFGFELPSGEPRKKGYARVAARLAKVADYCRNSGVKVVIENGGSFNSAADLAELLDCVHNSPGGTSATESLAVAYSIPVGKAAGDTVAGAMNVLGSRVACVKVKDLKFGHVDDEHHHGATPVALGDGDLNVKQDLAALAGTGYDSWAVYEYDASLAHTQVNIDDILIRSAKLLFEVGSQGQSNTQLSMTRARV